MAHGSCRNSQIIPAEGDTPCRARLSDRQTSLPLIGLDGSFSWCLALDGNPAFSRFFMVRCRHLALKPELEFPGGRVADTRNDEDHGVFREAP